jgi:hypothetical protein
MGFLLPQMEQQGVCKIFPPTVRASVEAKAIPVKSYELALPGLPA